MPDVATPVAESSPATIAPPKDPEHYAAWRQTGKLPEPPAAKPNSEASAASQKNSDAAGDSGESDTASEAVTNKQEQRAKPRGNAETRLNDLLADLKRAGLTPAELKTFKREAQQQQQQAEQGTPPPAKAPEAAKPAEAPKRPKLEDFESYEKYDEANGAYLEALADHRAELKFAEREARTRAEALQRSTNEKVEAAKTRYSDENARATIEGAAKAVFNEPAILPAVKAILDDSPVLVDVLYVMGSKPDELAEFVALAKANPGAAIRKAVLLERLVSEELAKTPGAVAAAETPARGESGQFVAAAPAKTTPARKVTEAPPPPKEAGGRAAAPPDEVESAATAKDFASFRHAANRRDLARFQGR
jgi:hypothetical protein